MMRTTTSVLAALVLPVALHAQALLPRIPPMIATPPTADENLRRVNALVPDFGGFYLANHTDPTVVLQDISRLAEAREALETVYGAQFQSRFARSEWKAVHGDYTYVALADWRDQLTTTVLGTNDVLSTGMDQIRNRVHVGVANENARGWLMGELAGLSIPAAAVLVEVKERDTFLRMSTDRLGHHEARRERFTRGAYACDLRRFGISRGRMCR